MKALRQTVVILLGILVLAGFTLLWLLFTELGGNFIIHRLSWALDNRLIVEKIQGTLATQLDLLNLQYQDEEREIKVEHISLQLKPSDLIKKSLHLEKATMKNVDITLHSSSHTSQQTQSKLEVLPIAILVDQLHIQKVTIWQTDKSLFNFSQLDVGGTWTKQGISIKQFALEAPAGHLNMTGELVSSSNYQGNATFDFDWRIDQHRFIGNAHANNYNNQTSLIITLLQPTSAKLNLNLTPHDDISWTLVASIPHFDPRILDSNIKFATVAAELTAIGNRVSATVKGTLELDTYCVLLNPLSLKLDDKILQIQKMVLEAPEATGQLIATGAIDFSSDNLQSNIELNWNEIELPTDLVGQPLKTNGTMNVQGSFANYRLQSQATLGPANHLANIEFDLRANNDLFTLTKFDVKRASSKLTVDGIIRLQPSLEWSLNIQAKQFNPSDFLKNRPGNLSFSLETTGQWNSQNTKANFKLNQLSGTLRQQMVSGGGNLELNKNYALSGELELKSGNNHLSLQGKNQQQNELIVDMALTNLEDYVPQTKGSLQSNFTVEGNWPDIKTNGRLNVQNIFTDYFSMANGNITFNVKNILDPNGEINIKSNTLTIQDYRFDTASFIISSRPEAHQLQVIAKSKTINIDLALSGQKQTSDSWQGSLSQLTLSLPKQTQWRLEQLTPLTYRNESFEIGNLCLTSGTPKLCVSGEASTAGKASVQFSLTQLPISLSSLFINQSLPVQFTGQLDGYGQLSRTTEGMITGQSQLISVSGSIIDINNSDHLLLEYKNLTLNAIFTPQKNQVTAKADLQDNGFLDGYMMWNTTSGNAFPFIGNVNLILNNLSFVEIFTPN